MSPPAAPEASYLVVAVLLARGASPAEVEARLAEKFGPVLMRLPFAPFTQTAYYGREMGEGIERGFFAFEKLVDPGDLASIKAATNEIEKEYEENDQRAVNLDPGVLSMVNFVLASGKPVAHRVYLARGIYAEIEYLYRFGGFKPLEWTYPDYREERVINWFDEVRKSLKVRRKGIEC